MKSIREKPLFQGGLGPLLMQPLVTNASLTDLLQTHRSAIDAKMLEYGAILFRGFGVDRIERVKDLIVALAAHPLDYVYRSTPRTSLGAGLYTATEHPPDQEIVLHNENAYQRSWPRRLLFCCLQAAASGGETTVADINAVSEDIGTGLVDEFRARQVQYVRHYHPNVDLPWRTVFQTESREAVADYCRRHYIEATWLDDDVLRTQQTCQGAIVHPDSRARVYFNQAHLFHISSLGTEAAAALEKCFGRDRLPRHARYGDGREIPDLDLARVRQAFQRNALAVRWCVGDVLLVDNLRVAHGRRPFRGSRQVVVSLLDLVSPPDTSSANLLH